MKSREKITRRNGLPRGRPVHQSTAKMRRTVEQMRSDGKAISAIAPALGIDAKTLRHHYVEALAIGHAKRRAAAIDELFRAARAGKVSAMVRILGLPTARKET